VAVLARNIWGHGSMASAVARAYKGVWGQNPSGVQGQSPCPLSLKLKHFWFLVVQWKPQFCPFFYN